MKLSTICCLCGGVDPEVGQEVAHARAKDVVVAIDLGSGVQWTDGHAFSDTLPIDQPGFPEGAANAIGWSQVADRV